MNEQRTLEDLSASLKLMIERRGDYTETFSKNLLVVLRDTHPEFYRNRTIQTDIQNGHFNLSLVSTNHEINYPNFIQLSPTGEYSFNNTRALPSYLENICSKILEKIGCSKK